MKLSWREASLGSIHWERIMHGGAAVIKGAGVSPLGAGGRPQDSDGV
jgi:hypothetical protein